MTLAEDKAALRKEVLVRRDAIAPDYREGKNILLCAQLLRKVDWDELAQRKEMQQWAETPDSADDGGKTANVPLTVAVYAAMKTEPNVFGFIAMAYNHEAHVCYPCMERLPEAEAADQGRKLHMVLRAVTLEQRDDCPFITDPLKAFDPGDPALAAYPEVAPEELDLVLVPLVAFDDANNRLGYGGGNYDRLLAQTRKGVQTIGIAYEEQRVDAVPTEPFDKPLQSVVSA
jgi:5-formyltetrahydrofolate cyclo-ligase